MAVFNDIWPAYLTLKLLWISLCNSYFPRSSSRCGCIGWRKNTNISLTLFYIVGREIGKKLVYESQIWAQKHKISCRAKARGRLFCKFSNQSGSISEHYITLQALKLWSTVSLSSSPLFPYFCKWGTLPVPQAIWRGLRQGYGNLGSELSGCQLLTNPPSFSFFSFFKYPVKWTENHQEPPKRYPEHHGHEER